MFDSWLFKANLEYPIRFFVHFSKTLTSVSMCYVGVVNNNVTYCSCYFKWPVIVLSDFSNYFYTVQANLVYL